MYEKNRRYSYHGKPVHYRKRGKNHDYARRKMRKFIRSLNTMQILCFAIAAIAVFFGILHSFSAMSGSGEEPLAASSDGGFTQTESDSASDIPTVKSTSSETASTRSTTATQTDVTAWQTVSVEEPSLIDSLQPSGRTAKYFIVVYKGSQSVAVYGKDKNNNYTKEVKIFTCSTGKRISPTRTGTYSIRAKYRWRRLEGNVFGQYNTSISSDYLFHSVPYLRQDASTLDGGEYDKLGTAASKGCIRLCVRDCKWIYDNCSVGTNVRIVDDSGPSGAEVPARKESVPYSGWDPSDEWTEGNPYFG